MPKRSERDEILSELEEVMFCLAADTSIFDKEKEKSFPVTGNMLDDVVLFYSIIKDSKENRSTGRKRKSKRSEDDGGLRLTAENLRRLGESFNNKHEG